MAERRPLISVVVPLQNEADNLPELYRRLSETALHFDSEGDMEFVFVDDGSSDDSLAILERFAKNDTRVVVVSHVRNYGSHAAVKAGLRTATGDYFAAISADLQDPPEMIPQFFAAAQKGFEIVWGMRAERKDPFLKTLYANTFYAIFRRFALKNLPKGGVDTFLIGRKVRDDLLALRERNNPPYYQMLWLGYPYAVVPYTRAARTAGVSKWSFTRRLKMAFDSLLAYTPAPMRLFTGLGAGLFVTGAGWMTTVLALGWMGTATTLSTGAGLALTLSGLNLLALGVVGEYLWRIAEDIRQRPESCIRRVIRHEEAPARSTETPTARASYRQAV